MPDWKPERRKRDPALLRRLHVELLGEPCEQCGVEVGTQLHHKVKRGQGGHDIRDNLLWLCVVCHGQAHGIRVIL